MIENRREVTDGNEPIGSGEIQKRWDRVSSLTVRFKATIVYGDKIFDGKYALFSSLYIRQCYWLEPFSAVNELPKIRGGNKTSNY